ncbi:MAG: alternative ribosome rescue aminoacyl-tRNA hydrolase ArfB [Candidatus Babeliales bacterium]
MKEDLFIQEGIIIPYHELVIATSRSGGPGGQHVNKTNTAIEVRWSVDTSNALTVAQKELIKQKLASRLTTQGELIVTASVSRSQLHNKKVALDQLATLVRKALYVPKKRKKMKVPEGVKEARLHEKAQRSEVKRLRSKKFDE